MRVHPLLVLAVLCCTSFSLLGGDSLQFRGPNRDGIYDEKGLKKAWPEGGPKQLWVATGLGKGFSSAVTAKGLIFATGEQDFKEYMFCFDERGKQVWRTEYGLAHDGGGYPGTRGTPTVDGDTVYLISSLGVVVAIHCKNGEKLWEVDTLKRFAPAKNPDEVIPRWAIAESVLIVGNLLICTPGAPGASIVALNKTTGKTVWTTKGLSDVSGYCSARLYTRGKLSQIITLTGKSLVGLDPETGNLIWSKDYPASWDIHANSPLFSGSIIYVSDGYGSGGIAFELAADGKSVKELWREKTLDIQHGGAVLVDGRIYGAANRGKWIALELSSGKVLTSGKGTGKGVIVYADGRLYGYGESGKIGIVDPKSTDLATISEFRVKDGSGQHWAHPTISNGRLYVRRGDVLLCYDLKN